MGFKELQEEDRRLLALQILRCDTDYAVNERVLLPAMGQQGHAISADTLRGILNWLEEQGLIEIEKLDPCAGGRLWVPKLTQRGADHCAGATLAPGVRRPRPDEV